MPVHNYVVGAYASLPEGRELQAEYYALLGVQPWIQGAELPFPGDLADPQQREWLAHHIPSHWHTNTVTLIPGTMQSIGRDPWFGLASPCEESRLAAIQFVIDAYRAITDFAHIRNSNDIAYLEIHSAPTAHANRDAMQRSVEEILSWDWHGTQLVIEHCDAYIADQHAEKGFLSLDEEIAICQETGIGLTINWGRSCIEARDAAVPQEHMEAAADADVLQGVMFSGASPEKTTYGYSWIDGHLPMSPDEPLSWMTAEHIASCTQVAKNANYIGAKVCVPQESPIEERLAYLQHIHDAGLLSAHNAEEEQ